MSEQLDAYLSRLTRALQKRGVSDARIVEEARAHVVDAVEDGLRRDLRVDRAELEAVVRFGAPDIVAALFVPERSHMLNRLLTVMCAFTLLATGYLSLSVIVLRPPRLNYLVWSLMAGLFVAQSVLALFALVGTARGGWVRGALLAGGLLIISVGVWWVHQTLSVPHFEGYALVLGSWVAVQGALTCLRLLQFDDFRIATRPN